MDKSAETICSTSTLQVQETVAPSRFPLRLPERRLILLLGDVLALLGAGVAALAAWANLGPGLAFNRTFVTQHWPWLMGLSVAWRNLCASQDV